MRNNFVAVCALMVLAATLFDHELCPVRRPGSESSCEGRL